MTDISSQTDRYRKSQWEGRVRFPKTDQDLAQNHEWCEIKENGGWNKLRFHDYDEIYQRPGLYEHLFYQMLKCRSPERVVKLLDEVRQDFDKSADSLRVIDLGAGNGIVGERLRERGVRHVLGIDIISEASQAAKRDRPKVYEDYLVADLCDLSEDTKERIVAFAPNALACVAALGFGDIPPRAYFNALSLIPEGGMLAFNIKDEFLDARHTHGFSGLIRRMVHDEIIRLEATRRYRHRINIDGEPLFYTAMIATKLKHVPESMLIEE